MAARTNHNGDPIEAPPVLNHDDNLDEDNQGDPETLNKYELYATETNALALNQDHPIRFVTKNWGDDDLTQEQWNEVRPRILQMLLKDCELKPAYKVGRGYNLATYDDAIQALDHQVNLTGKNMMTQNLPAKDRAHIDALHWAIENLLLQDVLVTRIKKIVGAALTCLVSRRAPLLWGWGYPRTGNTMVQFPKEDGNKILAECMKAYRVLDENCLWDIHAFRERDNNLYKMLGGRNLLACCAMIDMQVLPWLEKAKLHLQTEGIAGLEVLGETDLLSPSAIREVENRGEVNSCIHAITSKIPLAVNNDDMRGDDVGFATAGGKVLATLAPLMFTSAQMVKGGAWRLIEDNYCAVWMSIGTNMIVPWSMDVGFQLLRAHGICGNAPLVGSHQRDEADRCNNRPRLTYWELYEIPPVDEADEVY